MLLDSLSHDGLMELSMAHRAQPGEMFRQIFQVRIAVGNEATNQGEVRDITTRKRKRATGSKGGL